MGWVLIAEVIADLHALGLRVNIPILVDTDGEHTSDCLGVYYPDDAVVYVRMGLEGCELYRVVLHEIGHHLGLEHTRSGIMRYKRHVRADWSSRQPTRAQRRRWALEIGQAVMRLRAKTI